jgi:hypothetical protein
MKFGLIAGTVVAMMWILGAWPAYQLAGAEGLVGSAVAAGLCLFTVVICAVAQEWAAGRGPDWELGVFFGGMLFRMGFVLAGVAAFYSTGVFGFHSFVLWVLLFYLPLLGVETVHAYHLLRRTKT